MSERLAFALAFESDRPLRDAVRGGAPVGATVMSFGDRGPHLAFADGTLTDHGGVEVAPQRAATMDLVSTLETRPDIAQFVMNRIDETGARAEADRLVRSLQGAAHFFIREDFSRLSRWAPLLSVEAYGHASLTQRLLAQTRSLIRTAPRLEDSVAWYWAHAHALSHTSALAASSATSWLVEMARSFEWETWTPSFALVRERIQRLTARGAWVASRFGVGVLEPYLRLIVEAPQLLRTLDAVLGSTAIALASRESAALREVDRAVRHRTDRAAGGNDLKVLEACGRSIVAATEAFNTGGSPTVEDLRVIHGDGDGAEIDHRGLFPSIVALPALLGGDADVLFADGAFAERERRSWNVATARDALQRTGAIGRCSCGSGRPASACCAN